jgi:hypothetical protein
MVRVTVESYPIAALRASEFEKFFEAVGMASFLPSIEKAS